MSRLRTIDGKYVVRGTLGSGGMGVVLEAEQASMGRVVAIKLLHPHLSGDEIQMKRFMREARTAGMCGHPNVCTVFDAGFLEDGRPYIVMERLHGRTLAAQIADGQPMAPAIAVDIVLQVLGALEAVHQAGVVHRDVKPDNVFLIERADRVSGFHVKVLDFGTSKPMSGPERDLTGTGIAIGTAYYMSPEQARGERDLDGRVDVYACGVMLYELLSGQRPYTAANEHAILLRIIGAPPAPVVSIAPHVPLALDAIVTKAMAQRREDRFQTTAELVRALEGIRDTLAKRFVPSAAESTTILDRPQPPRAALPSSVRMPVALDLEPPLDLPPPSEPNGPDSFEVKTIVSDMPISRPPESLPPTVVAPDLPSHTAETRLVEAFDDPDAIAPPDDRGPPRR